MIDLKYNERVKKTFNYEKIKSAIETCKPKFFGNNVCIDLLWTPQIYFDYANGWAAGKPNKKNFNGSNYIGVTLGTSPRLFIDWYVSKNLFKKNEAIGKIGFFYPEVINDDEKSNWEEIQKYLESKYNAKDQENNNYIKFCSYKELEIFLKELEDIINKYNIKRNNEAYFYFDKNEASCNAEIKKVKYEILSCDETLVNLYKQLEDTNKAATASDVDMTVLINSINDKIKKVKDKKDNIIKNIKL